MDILLVILKFAGLIVGGTLGILGTLFETKEDVVVPAKDGQPERTEKRLNHWGKRALTLTVAGFGIALVAQISEEVKSARESANSQQRAESLLNEIKSQNDQSRTILDKVDTSNTLAQRSLNSIENVTTSIERVTTQFTKLHVFGSFRLPREEARLAPLFTLFDKFVEDPKTGGDFSATYTARIGEDSKLTTVTVRLDDADLDVPDDLRELLHELTHPRLWCGLYKSKRPLDSIQSFLWSSKGGPDLFAFVHQKVSQAELRFNVETREITVYWNGFSYPQEQWSTNRQIVAIRDLNHAQFTFFVNAPAGQSLTVDAMRAMTPVEIGVQFDNQFVTLRKFERSDKAGLSPLFGAVLPTTDEILGIMNNAG